MPTLVATYARAVKIGKIKCKITRPWISSSPVKVTHMGVVGMNSLTLQILGKKIFKIAYIESEKRLMMISDTNLTLRLDQNDVIASEINVIV